MRAPLLLAALLLAGCAGADGGPDAGAPAQLDQLEVVLARGDGTPAQTWTLVCGGGVAGDHPAAAAACTHLEGLDDPFAPLPADAVCTEQYGGPQTAHVTGRWRGEPVDRQLSRVDGCPIAQWDALGPLLPA
ncbi:SSI family serine proteinase inhibitor [Geodermatophilus sp. SYSU D00691]